MRKWKVACGAAVLALGFTTAAHADEWNKLTLLTFSAPVEMPGISLPAGTYRFELMDPSSSRRVIRVADKDGTKTYGLFLSISDQRLEPADKPVVMFQEAPAGAPQAVKAWFYPGETIGYEFVYPQDQATKIAKATHSSVLAMKDDSTASTTEDERVASMKGADVTRVDESGRAVSADAQLKESSSMRPAAGTTTAPSATTTASSATTTAQSTSTTAQSASTPAAAPTTAAPTTEPASAAASTAAPVTAAPATEVQPAPAPATVAQTTPPQAPVTEQPPAAPQPSTVAPAPVGTSGAAPARPARRSLPRTASELPLLALLGALALAGGIGARVARKALS
jgi:hypothetical protein